MSDTPFDGAPIQLAMIRDRQRLTRLFQKLQRAGTDGPLRADFDQLLADSVAEAQQRRRNHPQPVFSQDLPILAHREQIIPWIQSHQVLIICGETGSGKSTQLPKLCLQAGLGDVGLIGHTQPRRLAARSIASRLAEELQSPLGDVVGYKIRFTDKTRPQSYVKLMTDGILLAETQNDRYLSDYEALIIDEAHERSLNIDFLLGILAQLLPRRPELKLIITSATIDAERFADHFANAQGPAPILKVSGRSFPVEVRYRPLIVEDTERDEMAAIVDAIRELWLMDRGHILVFLPTEHDIRETHKRLRADPLSRDGRGEVEILPLYARLSNEEQNRVYQSTSARRIVLATNVAESSLTIPDIHYVIDTGTARISRYAARSKVQRLPIEPISRASADQRAGRCGRLAEGVCIRLYSAEDYAARPEFTTPEIQRTNLASVILRAKALRLGRIEDFPFLDPPRPEAIQDGYRTLFEIGALDDRRELTELGRRMSQLPVDPRIARIIFAAYERNCLSEILIIAAALEIQDPRERPLERQQQADEAHAKFVDEQSDFLGYLKLWDFYQQLKQSVSKSQLRKACMTNFLSPHRMFEWTEIHRQLLQLASTAGMRCRRRQDEPTTVHQALLTGFLSRIAYRSGDHEYTGAGGVKFHLWPGSGLFATKPTWCLIGELLETRRRYGRIVARIQPEWVEPLAEHLVKRRHEDPHWHRKSGSVMAWKSVTLFGLPIVNRRRVAYGPIDPQAAHEIFVREGLAQRDLDCQDKFYRHNESVLEQCHALAAKTRDSRYLVDEYRLMNFYFERLPDDIHDLRTLRAWLHRSPEHRPRLEMQVTDFVESGEPQPATEDFPDEVTLGALTLPVTYEFAPGAGRDGATVVIPEDGLLQLHPGQVEWGVPGHLEEKIVALIRSLPKAIRRGLIPAPDTARKVASQLDFGRGDFYGQLAERLSAIAEEPVSVNQFDLDKIPPHLRLNIRVLDPAGQTIAEGRDLARLSSQPTTVKSVSISKEEEACWVRDQIRTWDFEELPTSIPLLRHGVEVSAFPSLVDRGDHVSMHLASSQAIAHHESRGGIRRLYVLQQRKALRSQVNWLPRMNEVSVWAAGLLARDQLQTQLMDLIADRAFFQARENLPRTRTEFLARLENSAERIGLATQDVARLLPTLFEAYWQVRLALEKCPDSMGDTRVDVAQQLQELVAGPFLLATPWLWLSSFPRYLSGMVYRLEKLTISNLDKDRRLAREILPYWQRYVERRRALDSRGEIDPELETFRWMIEEYRISCFAQPLGTSIPVSPKRLDRQWAKIGTWVLADHHAIVEE